MADLTNIASIEELLRTVTPGIKVGDEEPDAATNEYDLSRTTIDNWRTRQEAIIVNRLSRFYVVPLALTSDRTVELLKDIATRYGAYAVWLALHPQRTRDNLPASVTLWKSEADALLDQIVPLGKNEPVDGRDIILDGESLRTGAGDIGTAAVEFTTLLGFGGTRE
ncbi:MAG: hypothetical protein AB1752_11645 [Candidatus Zixiibacteriota bacterium]